MSRSNATILVWHRFLVLVHHTTLSALLLNMYTTLAHIHITGRHAIIISINKEQKSWQMVIQDVPIVAQV
jgi:hypothetical protein